ncbi:MAG: hypothetical protein QW520_06550 [Methanomassiliicoccales archaeon]
MAARKSKEKSQDVCNIKGCDGKAERSISAAAAKEAKLPIEENERRAHLCKKHYKEYKKATKQNRILSSLGR